MIPHRSPGRRPVLDAVLDRDAEGMVAALVDAGFLAADHGHDPQTVWEYASAPYVPYLEDEFTFTRSFTGDALQQIMDITGPYAR